MEPLGIAHGPRIVGNHHGNAVSAALAHAVAGTGAGRDADGHRRTDADARLSRAGDPLGTASMVGPVGRMALINYPAAVSNAKQC